MNHFFWNAMSKRFASYLYNGFRKDRMASKVVTTIVFLVFIGIHVWIGSLFMQSTTININIVIILLIFNIFSVCRQLYKLVNHTFHDADDLY